MGIFYDETRRIFKLDTPKSSYIIGIVDEENFIGHVYYGERLNTTDVGYLMRLEEPPFVPSQNNRDRVTFLDSFPMEYPAAGLGDFREACIEVRTGSGNIGLQLNYVNHKIYPGKPKLEKLPATFGDEQDCTTLEILCEDQSLHLQAVLLYTVFEELDVITRSVRVMNQGGTPINLTKVLSACVDMDNKDFEMISLHGSWARERRIQRRRIGYGKQSVSSMRGESSHQDHPFMALVTEHATEDRGEVYGFHFVYSGNFIAQAELNQFDMVRAVMGIHPHHFSWKLESGTEFTAPEVVMVYSAEGIGKMSRTLHDLYRKHLIRGVFKDCKRPILINNWEATYFDFDTDKLLAIAREAAKNGIEMLVMDDGWFGNRSSDNMALGDWFVNEDKLKGGLKHLVDEVNQIEVCRVRTEQKSHEQHVRTDQGELGTAESEKTYMQFGIWMEPEMISPDSDLYRAHPDWAIQIPGRTPSLCRNQCVLDLSRPEVVDYVYKMIYDILSSANIAYVKWDMNRQLSDLGSAALPADRQGELYHRYVLGVYELQERLVRDFPKLLLENCASGGARFDPGMLYFSPQIWSSDDTDAIERLMIQEGTAMLYPLSAMGAHVSDCPNHAVGRTTPFTTRGYVALAGTFGYELDITKISEADRSLILPQTQMYHRYHDLVRTGDYYRIASYAENHYYDCWQVTSKDKRESLVTFIQVLSRPNVHSRRVYLKGLAADATYCVTQDKIGEDFVKGAQMVTAEVLSATQTYTGDVLMKAGMNINMQGDFTGVLISVRQLQ